MNDSVSEETTYNETNESDPMARADSSTSTQTNDLDVPVDRTSLSQNEVENSDRLNFNENESSNNDTPQEVVMADSASLDDNSEKDIEGGLISLLNSSKPLPTSAESESRTAVPAEGTKKETCQQKEETFPQTSGYSEEATARNTDSAGQRRRNRRMRIMGSEDNNLKLSQESLSKGVQSVPLPPSYSSTSTESPYAARLRRKQAAYSGLHATGSTPSTQDDKKIPATAPTSRQTDREKDSGANQPDESLQSTTQKIKAVPTRSQINDIETSTSDDIESSDYAGMNEGDLAAEMARQGVSPLSVAREYERPSTHRNAKLDVLEGTAFGSHDLERLGSFISGGQGPFLSDSTPGAFQAQGRAFGELPEWFRTQGYPNIDRRTVAARDAVLRQLSSRSLPSRRNLGFFRDTSQHSLQELRMSSTHGSFTVMADYRGMDSTESETSSSGLAVARATLLQKSSSTSLTERVNGNESEHEDVTADVTQSHHRDADIDSHEATNSAEGITLVSAEEVTSEEAMKEQKMRFVVYGVYSLVAILSVVLVVLLLASTRQESISEAQNSRYKEPELLFPRQTDLPDLEPKCDEIPTRIVEDFSPILECYCGRSIPGIPTNIINAHNHMVRVLIERKIVRFPPLSTDCTDPRNLALLWLAEAEPQFESVEAMTTRYLLGVLFHTMTGLQWGNNSLWLTSHSECAWFGVRCNSNLTIEEIQLPGNSLNGTIPTSIFQLPALRVFNITDNIGVYIEEDSDFSSFVSDSRLVGDGSSLTMPII